MVIDLGPGTERLSALIEGVSQDSLTASTPCTEYCVGDLLDHVAGLTIAFGGAATKATGESATMGPSGSASNLDRNWRVSLPQRLDELAQAWREPSAWQGMTRVGGQELPGEVAGTILFGELAVHGWDLARATAIPFEPDPGGVAPLFEVVSHAFGPGQDAARGSAFAPAVPVPDDAPRFDRILGLLGRNPAWS